MKSIAGIEAFRALERVVFFFLKIDDLSPIAGLPHLQDIVLRGVVNVTDITALGQLPMLRQLEIESIGWGARDTVHLRSIGALANATELQSALLREVVIDDRDVTPLIGLRHSA